VSDIAIQSSATCLAAAQATILLSFNKSKNVVFKDVNLEAKATATVADCQQSTTVGLPALHDSVSAAINALMQNHAAKHNDVTTLQLSVTQALTSSNIKQAIDQATASYRMVVQQTDGNVSVDDFNIRQVATALLSEALENTQVTDSEGVSRPLGDVVTDVLARQKTCPAHLERNVALSALALVTLTTGVVVAKKLRPMA
jgi:hypothetical protein